MVDSFYRPAMIMNTFTLEQRLLSVYRLALAQHNWAVAEHLLAAIEAMESSKPLFEQAILDGAYLELGRTALQGCLSEPGHDP